MREARADRIAAGHPRAQRERSHPARRSALAAASASCRVVWPPDRYRDHHPGPGWHLWVFARLCHRLTRGSGSQRASWLTSLTRPAGAAEAHVVSGEALEEAHQAATTDTAYPDGLTAASARTEIC